MKHKRTQLFSCLAALIAAALVFTACPNQAGGSSSGGGTTPVTPKYKVTLEKTVGGNVTVSTTLPADGMVPENTEITFTASPLKGYRLEKWELNGKAVNGTALSYTLKVTEAAAVKVFFKHDGNTTIIKHKVTFTAGKGGTIGADTTIPAEGVAAGTDITFTAAPETGYEVDTWTVTPDTALIANGKAGETTAKVKITADKP